MRAHLLILHRADRRMSSSTTPRVRADMGDRPSVHCCRGSGGSDETVIGGILIVEKRKILKTLGRVSAARMGAEGRGAE